MSRGDVAEVPNGVDRVHECSSARDPGPWAHPHAQVRPGPHSSLTGQTGVPFQSAHTLATFGGNSGGGVGVMSRVKPAYPALHRLGDHVRRLTVGLGGILRFACGAV